MAIRIIDEPDIVLTRADYERLRAEYATTFQHWYSTQPPPSFEQWVRQQQEYRRYDI